MTLPQFTPPTLFFAGTDTDVGKTFAACVFSRRIRQTGRRVGVYKPIASGCRDTIVAGDGFTRISDDACELADAAGCPERLSDVCPQMFLAPLAPPAASAAENATIDPHLLRRGADRWHGHCDVLLVEGAGGLFSPLADGVLNIDLAKKFGDVRLLIVAANRLGVIHQVLSTVAASKHRGITPAGIILNCTSEKYDPSAATNGDQIARYTDVPIIANLPFGYSPLLASSASDCDNAADASEAASGVFFSENFIEALFMQ